MLTDEGMCECYLQGDYLIKDLVKCDTKKNKLYREANLTSKHNGDKDTKETFPVTLIDGLSSNCRQTWSLQPIKIPV